MERAKTTVALAIAVLLGLGATTVEAGTTYSYTMTAKSYSGSRDRQYKVYVPDGFSGARPLVMVLHGCKQTNEDPLNDWGWKQKADAAGFILVMPFITTYDGMRNQNCWGFWLDQHQHQGAGEPEDLKSIADQVATNFSIDANARYITGLSSGGAMSMVAAVTHNEYWAAAAPAAGLPYSEMSSSVSLSGQCPGSATFKSVTDVANAMKREMNNSYVIPLMVLQSNNDCTVVQPAGRNQRDAHVAVFGGTKAIDGACSDSFPNMYNGDWYNCKHEKYTADGYSGSRAIVETIFFNGPTTTANVNDTNTGHFWVGGYYGNEGLWSVRTGPSYPDIVWDFFSRHTRSGQPSGGNGVPTIKVTGNNPASVDKGGTYTDAGATATDPEDGALAVAADCSAVNTAVAGQYYCTYQATDSAGNTVVATRTVNVVDTSAPALSCATQTSSSSAHISNGRATKGGSYNLYAITTGDKARLGYYFTSNDSITLYEGETGKWYSQKPNGCTSGGGGGGNGNLYCATARVSAHRTAGRVADSGSICKTVGGLDNVDPYNYSYSCNYQITYNGDPNVTIKETSEGYFEKVSGCP